MAVIKTKTNWIIAGILASTVAAHADTQPSGLICGQPRYHVGGADTAKNPILGTEVHYYKDVHSWRVFHSLADGKIYSRSEQYAMADQSNEHKFQWFGNYNHNPSVTMIGEVRLGRGGNIVYLEWMYKNNRVEMSSEASCEWNYGDGPGLGEEPTK